MKRLPLIIIALSTTLLFGCKKDNLEEAVSNQQLNESFGNKNGSKADLIFYVLGEGNKLDKYNIDRPFNLISSVTIMGLQPSEKILAIDFRPATGQLYGIGSTSRIYVINQNTGVARAVGTEPFIPALSGQLAGFDFNPTVDRIRIVTNTGQNLRVNPETGLVQMVDGMINGVAGASVTSVAYTNNFSGAAATTLYDIDVTTDMLYKQLPPNDGTLVAVGSLGIDLEGEGGFDIASPGSNTSDNSNGIKSEFSALAVYTYKQKTSLLTIDLATGKAKELRKFNDDFYYGIAIPTDPVAYAVSGNNFITFNPYATTGLVSKTITGTQMGETIVGIDFRPFNAQLYAIGSNSRIYTINTSTGAASFVATISVPLTGTSFGVDFNPVPDRIRVVSNTGQNLRINPADGVTITDGILNPGTPAISAAAYNNNFAGTATTTLYVIDASNDRLFIQNPPNNGTLVPVGNLGVNIEAGNGFDIGGISNNAFGIFTVGGTSRVYSVNLSNGSASTLSSFPSAVSGFALGLGF